MGSSDSMCNNVSVGGMCIGGPIFFSCATPHLFLSTVYTYIL